MPNGMPQHVSDRISVGWDQSKDGNVSICFWPHPRPDMFLETFSIISSLVLK